MVDFLHPSVSSTIIDNSTVFVTAQGQTMLFAAFKAPSGPDNKLLLVTSSSQRAFYYGNSNMRLYGQTSYNLDRWLDAGGQALCFRVLPYIEADSLGNPLQQSTYACYILEVGTKTISTVKHTKIRVRTLGDGLGTLSAETEMAIRDDPSLATILLAPPSGAGAGGYTWYPITVIRGANRGAFYNTYGIGVELITTLDNTYTQRLYQLNVFSSTSHLIESFAVSLYPDAVDASGLSQFLPNVLAQYSGVCRAVFSEANYDSVTEFVNADTSVTAKIDILFNQERNVTVPETLHAANTLDAGAVLSPPVAVFNPIGGGTDGDWLGPNSLESLLYKAYSGTGDFVSDLGDNLYDTHFADIWDKKRYEIDLTLDANYPWSVKTAMSAFASTRGDLMSLLDLGFTSSPGQALQLRTSSLPINSFYSAIWAQDFTVFDASNGIDIRVTPTYFLAQTIPTVDNSAGIHWPFVGPRRGGIVGFDSVSWIPDESNKEALYQAQVNYAETDVIQTAFMSQTTSQLINSALSDVSHVRALLRIRRNLEKIGGTVRFEFNDKTTWGQLQYSVTQYLQTWIANRACSGVSGLVYASNYDMQSRIVRIKAQVTFTGIIERVMIDIIVNR